MRSAVLLFAFSASTLLASSSAFAATSYTNPLAHQPRVEKPREISMTFVNTTGQNRAVAVDGMLYRLSFGQNVRVTAPVGATIRLVANQDSKLDGTVLMQVAATDTNRLVRVQ